MKVHQSHLTTGVFISRGHVSLFNGSMVLGESRETCREVQAQRGHRRDAALIYGGTRPIASGSPPSWPPLGMGLYRIDLARVVSKYIGETERNLARLFSAAEQIDVVLFFDEADALFGRRAEVGGTRAERSRAANRAWLLMTRRPGSVCCPWPNQRSSTRSCGAESVMKCWRDPTCGGGGTATVDALV